ncbi:hypothetical protein BKA93DRAFT_118320 [Sparassis latifolia]
MLDEGHVWQTSDGEPLTWIMAAGTQTSHIPSGPRSSTLRRRQWRRRHTVPPAHCSRRGRRRWLGAGHVGTRSILGIKVRFGRFAVHIRQMVCAWERIVDHWVGFYTPGLRPSAFCLHPRSAPARRQPQRAHTSAHRHIRPAQLHPRCSHFVFAVYRLPLRPHCSAGRPQYNSHLVSRVAHPFRCRARPRPHTLSSPAALVALPLYLYRQLYAFSSLCCLCCHPGC